MAKTQVKPSSGGSFADATGKTSITAASVPPYGMTSALHAVNLYTSSAGAGARAQTATKIAAAVKLALQWV